MMNVGDQVWFTAPRNVTQDDHGLVPGQVVAAVVTDAGWNGTDWYTVEYDGGREISAADAELSHRPATAAPNPARTYWANYERCLNRVAAEARTVDALIVILNEHYRPSCGEAFFPGGAERDLRGTLLDCGWRVRWSRADYWYAISEPEGNGGITFTEGDIDRGVQVPNGMGEYRGDDLLRPDCAAQPETARFALDCAPQHFFPAVSYGRNWNGWLTPVVTGETLARVIDVVDPDHMDMHLHIAPDGTAYLSIYDDRLTEVIPCNAEGYYDLSVLGWTFIAAGGDDV